MGLDSGGSRSRSQLIDCSSATSTQMKGNNECLKGAPMRVSINASRGGCIALDGAIIIALSPVRTGFFWTVQSLVAVEVRVRIWEVDAVIYREALH